MIGKQKARVYDLQHKHLLVLLPSDWNWQKRDVDRQRPFPATCRYRLSNVLIDVKGDDIRRYVIQMIAEALQESWGLRRYLFGRDPLISLDQVMIGL